MPISAQIIEAIEQLEAQLPASVLSKEDLSTQEKTVCVFDTNALLDALFFSLEKENRGATLSRHDD